MQPSPDRAAELVLATALALLVDLFLDWHRSTVAVAGTVVVKAGSAGAAGIGVVAVVLVAAVLAVEAARLRHHEVAGVRASVVSLALSAAALVFTLAAFFSSSTDVTVAGGVGVAVDRLVPAYVGVLLAVALVVETAIRVEGLTRARGGRVSAGHA